jgi:hypothetical protein
VSTINWVGVTVSVRVEVKLKLKLRVSVKTLPSNRATSWRSSFREEGFTVATCIGIEGVGLGEFGSE